MSVLPSSILPSKITTETSYEKFMKCEFHFTGTYNWCYRRLSHYGTETTQTSYLPLIPMSTANENIQWW